MYTIEETAQRCGLTTHTLRYYEREGLLQPIGRNRGGQRRYSDDDLSWINFVLMLKETGMTLSRIREYVACDQRGDDGFSDKADILDAHRNYIRAQIKQMTQCLTQLDNKIDLFRRK